MLASKRNAACFAKTIWKTFQAHCCCFYRHIRDASASLLHYETFFARNGFLHTMLLHIFFLIRDGSIRDGTGILEKNKRQH